MSKPPPVTAATLRDIYAAFALVGVIASKEYKDGSESEAAYLMADAMLEERNKPNESK